MSCDTLSRHVRIRRNDQKVVRLIGFAMGRQSNDLQGKRLRAFSSSSGITRRTQAAAVEMKKSTTKRTSLGAFACSLGAVLALPGLVHAGTADERTGTLVVVNKGEDSVSFIDLATGRERQREKTGPSPHEAALSPEGKRVAVAAYGGSIIDVFEVSSGRRAARIDVAPNAAPHGLAWVSGQKLAVAAEKSRSLVLVDVAKGTFQAIPLEQAGTHMVVLSPDRRTAYAANVAAGTVSVVDLSSRRKVKDIRVGGNPEGIAVSPDGKHLWVGDNSAPRLRIVDLGAGKIVDTLPTDPVPIRVVISRDGRTAIASNIGAGSLSVFDARSRKLLRTIPVSGKREAVQVTVHLTPDGAKAYVAETGADKIAEVDLNTGEVIRRIATGKGGDGLALAERGP